MYQTNSFNHRLRRQSIATMQVCRVLALQALLLLLSCSSSSSFGVGGSSTAFLMTTSSSESNRLLLAHTSNPRRRQLLRVGAGGMFSGLPFFGSDNNNEAKAATGVPSDKNKKFGSNGPTGEVVKVVKGMKHKRLGNSDIYVSELGLGTQRWVGRSVLFVCDDYRCDAWLTDLPIIYSWFRVDRQLYLFGPSLIK